MICLNYIKIKTKYPLCLQGARDLAKPPTLTEIFQSNLKNSESKEEDSEKHQNEAEMKSGLKRKYDHSHCSEDKEEDDSQKANEESLKDGKLKKAKNVGLTYLFIFMTLFK